MKKSYHESAWANDLLASWSKRDVFHEAVWISDEATATKVVLLCIGRFLDQDARSSSMSYAQVARECGLHERTVKRIAKEIRGVWLRIEIGQGQWTTQGRQNLYHGICPPEVVGQLRKQFSKHDDREGVALDPKGCSSATPGSVDAAGRGGLDDSKGWPGVPQGWSQATRTSLSLKEEREGEGCSYATPNAPSRNAPPHLNGVGFIINAEEGLIIPTATIDAWRDRFPSLLDLEARIESHSAKILAKGRMHPGWSAPASWMVKLLAEDNEQAAREAKITEARLAKANGLSPSARKFSR